MVATLPRSTALLRPASPTADLLLPLREHAAGRMAGLALVLLGLGLLAHAWLALCRQVSTRRTGQSGGARVAEDLDLVRFAALLWSLPLLIAPPLFSRDGWSYAAQGAMVSADVSPYRFGPAILGLRPVTEAVDPMWQHTPAPYGPLPLWFGGALAETTLNPLMLVIGHRVIALAGLALLAWAMPRLAEWGGVNPAFASALVLASPFMIANGVAGLHNDLLMAGLMAAALVVAAEHGWVYGALLGGLAAAVKLPGGLVCIGVALVTLGLQAGLAGRVRRLAGCAAVSVAVLIVLGVLSGLGLGWVRALSVPGSVHTPLSLTTVVGDLLERVGALLGFGLPEDALVSLLRGLGMVATLAIAVGVALRWPTGRRERALAGMALVLGAAVLLSAVVHLWYFMWPLPFLAALPLRRFQLTGLVVLSVLLGLVAPLDSSLHGAYLVIVVAIVIVAALFAVLLLTPRARDRVARIVEAGWLPDGLPDRDGGAAARPEPEPGPIGT